MHLLFAGLFGFLSVAIGAYAEHGLRASISDKTFSTVMTAIRYHQIHSVALLAIGLALLMPSLSPYKRLLAYAGYGFAVGILLFSFSIYAAALLGMPELTKLAPFGGLAFMGAWLLIAYIGVKSFSQH